MIHSAEYCPIVIVGFWNNAIFNPEWVAKYLLFDSKFNVEMPLQGNGSLRFSTEDLRIFILDGKLNFAILKKENKVFKHIEELARKIADYLPHTPVASFGINFLFESEDTGRLNAFCNTKEEEEFLKAGYSINGTAVKRNMVVNDQILNLTIHKTEKKYLFDFNYHFNVNSLVELKDKLEDGIIIKYKDQSLELLQQFYGLTLNGDIKQSRTEGIQAG